jgi:hypothetical protein
LHFPCGRYRSLSVPALSWQSAFHVTVK